MAQGYAGIPSGPLSAYLGVREANREAGLQELQGATQVQGMLARAQAQQRMQKFQAEMASARTPDEQIAIATKYGAPADVIQHISGQKSRELIAEQNRVAAQVSRDQAESLRRDLATQAQTSAAERAAADRASREQIAAEGRANRLAIAGTREPPAPIVQTDEQGNTTIYDRQGNLIRKLGKTGKPSAQVMNEQLARAKMNRDLTSVIPTLEEISKEGGLLDQATGSGAGALVDIASGFFGYGTPGAIAIGKLKPATDAVLKLVPRFEGPQSDKDTKMYQDAAGNLANPSTPNSVKKEAAKTILKLYKRRQGQFVTRDFETATGGSGASAAGVPPGVSPQLWGVMTSEEKALWQR